jgi:glycosyltransferase involved in cell wall biosynthesis
LSVRIAFVSDSVSPWNFGGLETLEHAEADELAKRHELHFFSLRWPGMKPEFRKGRITYHTFHDIDHRKFYRHGRRSIREALVFTVGMLRIFGYRFDVIQSNQFPILQLPVLKLYCLLTGCKLILNVHEVWDLGYWTTYLGGVMGRLANIYASWALRMGDYYISNSSTTERGLLGLGVKRDRISVFAPTIDHRRLEAIKGFRQRKEVIFAGRLIKEKRLDKWLEVFGRIAKGARAKGVIIGDGPERKRIESLVRKMGLGKQVEVRGFYSDHRMVFKRIKEAGLFLHMSEREGLSTVALESIALGTPVLLPSYTPIPKDVKDMCVVVPEARLPGMAAKILRGPKKDYIMNSDRIERFYTSSTPSVYGEIFKRIGV